MGKDDLINEVWKHFGERQLVFLATSDDDQPRVRPVMLINLNGEFFVSVKAVKPVVKQISKNSKTSFCLELGNIMSDYSGAGYVRVECEAEILDDKGFRTKLYKDLDFIKRYYDSLDDYLARGRIIKLKPVVIRYMAPDSWKPVKIRL
jgi:uncharacterized pyridoxamine 5'-phosphate oxidase family protein